MINRGRAQLAISLVWAFACGATIGSEPNNPPVQVEFVTRGRKSVAFDQQPSIVPSWEAAFILQWRFEPTSEPNAADLLKTSAGETLSALQRELLKTEQRFWLEYKVDGPYTSKHGMPFGSARYKARAVGREQAEKMAHAALEFLVRDEKASVRRMKQDHIEKLSQMQDGLRANIAEAEEKIKAKSSQVPAAYQKYQDAVANSPYSLHPSSHVPDEIRKTIFEMDKMLDVLNIEMAGIKSKLVAINKYSREEDVRQSESLALTLKEMLIRQQVELVGAGSREQEIMKVKKREERLYGQYEAFSDLKGEIETLEADVKRYEADLRSLDRDIEFLGPEERTFIIEGAARRNQVVIQEVRVQVQPNPHPEP